MVRRFIKIFRMKKDFKSMGLGLSFYDKLRVLITLTGNRISSVMINKKSF